MTSSSILGNASRLTLAITRRQYSGKRQRCSINSNKPKSFSKSQNDTTYFSWKGKSETYCAKHSPKKIKIQHLSETERKKIIRRLYLKWHPDKNAENLDIATEVFKHLQIEINRMEKQSLSDQQNMERSSRRPFSTSSTRFQSEKFSFQRFYTSWNQEATSHKSERQHFREHYTTSFAGSSHSNRFFVPPTFKSVGNPVEARRWLRQARANFSAARNDLHKNANEWVCFKCYLATKLALIAADYAVRGKSDKDVKTNCSGTGRWRSTTPT
ncbi:hypothetical protein CRUP_019694 [Coryphaenoides rupestris]|nr:hypothetical protein CRUP_019694 [Coryphaenoides rupestris]